MTASATDEWSHLSSNPQICGAQIIFPWRPIDDGSGTYDWSSVEGKITPWASAGKKVGLTFVGVDEVFEHEGRGNTTLLATPDYVMKQVDVVTCAPPTKRDTGDVKHVPPTPVYWEAGYAENWKKFIKAAILKYQDDPRIAYLKFGIGAADETFPMTAASNEPSCVERWNQKGMSYDTWLAYALSIIDYVGSLHPRIAIAFDMNRIGVWDTGTDGFAEAISARAAKYRFLVGNEGFNGFDPKWNALYKERRRITQLYMQTNSPQFQQLKHPGSFPTMLKSAQALGIQVYELYPREFEMAYRPNRKVDPAESASIRAAIESLGTPKSCEIDPNWGHD
jgi:hypothetical protein